MTSNTNSTGGTVESTGIAKIDDILVTGVNTLGVSEVLFSNRITIYPNPNSGTFHVSTQNPMQEISIYSINGVKVYENLTPPITPQISLDLPSGIYLVRVLFEGSESFSSTRMIVH
jgi:hypothetical protein